MPCTSLYRDVLNYPTMAIPYRVYKNLLFMHPLLVRFAEAGEY